VPDRSSQDGSEPTDSLDPELTALIVAARQDADAFAETMGFDQAEIHRRLQAYLDNEPDATIGMPRGHGKSVQAGLREAWEIGKNPAIRIKHICQTDDKASEQVRFVSAILQHLSTGWYSPTSRPSRYQRPPSW
jgi:hypothetical protein